MKTSMRPHESPRVSRESRGGFVHIVRRRPNCRGDPEWMKNALATKCDDQQAITEVTDAYGNVTEIKAKKTLTKKEIKKMTKEIKAKIKSGAELDDDEEAFAEEHELWK